MSTRTRNSMAPVATAVLLVVMLVVRVLEHAPQTGIEDYMTNAARQIDAIPVSIGVYIGVDREVTPGVIELLQPNRIFQRHYSDPDPNNSTEFSVVLVHCGSAKDMTGHYPPNCYPRAGWLTAEPSQTVSVAAAELIIPATLYHFEYQQGFAPTRADILSFFIVPTGPQRYGPDIRMVDLASRSTRASKLGAAQVQIITSSDIDQQQRDAIWRAVIEATYPALHAIAEGVS
jgi:hypothetical protein